MDTPQIDLILTFQQLVGERAAYPLIATLLTLALQLGKMSPYTRVLYEKTPLGLRWLTPVIAGAAMGFVHGYQKGYTVVGALMEMVFGIFGVSATSMGIHAALTESALPYNGAAGGKKTDGEKPAEPPA